MNAPVSAIVLAAGQGLRMGAQKLLLQIGDYTIVERVVDAVLEANVGEVIVVLGHDSGKVAEALGNRPVRLVCNQNYAGGQSTSLIAGVKAVDRQARALLVALGDQPFLTSSLINRLINCYSESACLAARLIFRDNPGHPVLMDAALIPELLELKGDTGAREVLSRYGNRVLHMAVADRLMLEDIDTPADYLRLRDEKTSCAKK